MLFVIIYIIIFHSELSSVESLWFEADRYIIAPSPPLCIHRMPHRPLVRSRTLYPHSEQLSLRCGGTGWDGSVGADQTAFIGGHRRSKELNAYNSPHLRTLLSSSVSKLPPCFSINHLALCIVLCREIVGRSPLCFTVIHRRIRLDIKTSATAQCSSSPGVKKTLITIWAAITRSELHECLSSFNLKN